MPQNSGAPPPSRTSPLSIAVLFYRNLALLNTAPLRAGRRWARDVRSTLASLAILWFFAALGGSDTLACLLAASVAATALHAAFPAKEGHTLSLGAGYLGVLSGRPAAARRAECVLAILAGLWAESAGDFAARNYLVAAGLSGLLVLGAAARRERDLRDDLADGARDARNRF